MRYELVSVANGERLLGTAVPVDPKALKRASHRVSDAVYEKILGVRGAFATRIAYVAVDGPVTKRSYRLVVSDADGANERIVFGSPDPIMSPAWSPDGRSIAYVSFHTGLAAIYVQTLSTGAQVQVSAKSGINGAPSYSPDGSQLALALSRRDGNVDVYVLTLATQELKASPTIPRSTPEPSGATPLYFTSDRAVAAGLQRRVESGARPRRITFDGSTMRGISPDGRQLAVVTQDRAPGSERWTSSGGRGVGAAASSTSRRRLPGTQIPRTAGSAGAIPRSSRAMAACSNRSRQVPASCGSRLVAVPH